VKKRQARAARQKHKITMFDSDESENMEQDSDVGAIKFEPEILDVSDDDDSPRRPTRSNKRRKRFHTETDPVESDGSLEDGIGIPTRWKGSRKRRTIVHSDDELANESLSKVPGLQVLKKVSWMRSTRIVSSIYFSLSRYYIYYQILSSRVSALGTRKRHFKKILRS
jgi:hypothetical protein